MFRRFGSRVTLIERGARLLEHEDTAISNAVQQLLEAEGIDVLLARMPMSEVDRARERGETHGLMKILVDAETDFLIGAAIFGIGGDEVVQGILNLMYAGAPYQVLRKRMGIHPTVSELLPGLLDRLEPIEPRPGQAGAGEPG